MHRLGYRDRRTRGHSTPWEHLCEARTKDLRKGVVWRETGDFWVTTAPPEWLCPSETSAPRREPKACTGKTTFRERGRFGVGHRSDLHTAGARDTVIALIGEKRNKNRYEAPMKRSMKR